MPITRLLPTPDFQGELHSSMLADSYQPDTLKGSINHTGKRARAKHRGNPETICSLVLISQD